MIKEWGEDGDCSFEILRPRTYDSSPEYIPEELKETGVLELVVDFKHNKKKLLSDFKTLLNMYKPHAPKQPRARKSHN